MFHKKTQSDYRSKIDYDATRLGYKRCSIKYYNQTILQLKGYHRNAALSRYGLN
jgi:hypothetical protein